MNKDAYKNLRQELFDKYVEGLDALDKLYQSLNGEDPYSDAKTSTTSATTVEGVLTGNPGWTYTVNWEKFPNIKKNVKKGVCKIEKISVTSKPKPTDSIKRKALSTSEQIIAYMKGFGAGCSVKQISKALASMNIKLGEGAIRKELRKLVKDKKLKLVGNNPNTYQVVGK